MVPDLCVLGKALAGGFPLTAVAGRQELMSYFDPALTDQFVLQRGTLSGNPVAAVAALATLNVLRREGTYDRLFETGRQLMDSLERLLKEAGIPAQGGRRSAHVRCFLHRRRDHRLSLHPRQ